MIFWPHDPPDDAVVLVRAVGQTYINLVRKKLDSASIPWVMGGMNRNDVKFYVPKDQRKQAENIVRSND